MSNSLKKLRRQAKDILRQSKAGQGPFGVGAKLADALHYVAKDAGFESWPRLKAAKEASAMSRAERAERLKIALYNGQHWVVEALLSEDPSLPEENLGLSIALLDQGTVESAVSKDSRAATEKIGVRSPILHLCFSQHIHAAPEKAEAMLQIASVLVSVGADVDDSYPAEPGSDHGLSALYGALGHAGNLPLARWLLENGADPNDNESLYHATELGHHDGLDLLLAHGAKPAGTNALLRAMDFNDHVAVEKLLAAGADPNEGFQPHESGQPMGRVMALHQAARRMNDARMAEILLDAGARTDVVFDGLTPFAMARAYGNRAVADLIAARGGETALSPEVAKLARIAEGETLGQGEWLDPEKLPDELRNMTRSILHIPGKYDHVKRLIASGAEWDRPDDMGLTPVQIAGWEGLPDLMAYFLSLKPDLSHVNDFGGTLLSTIIHGSENAPERDKRDHLTCAKLALEEGVALPIRAVELAGQEDMAAFLADWADRFPGQVVE